MALVVNHYCCCGPGHCYCHGGGNYIYKTIVDYEKKKILKKYERKKLTHNPRDVDDISWAIFLFSHGCDMVVCGMLVSIPHHCYDGWVHQDGGVIDTTSSCLWLIQISHPPRSKHLNVTVVHHI